MAAKIYMEPKDVFPYFRSHGEELERRHKLLAENREFGLEMCLCSLDGFCNVYITVDGDEVFSEDLSATDAEADLTDLYNRYLHGGAVSAILEDEDPDDTDLDQEDAITERETELNDAMEELLLVFYPDFQDCPTEDLEAVVEDFKDRICQRLYDDYGLSVYRPMILVDEDGTESFEEYPYPDLEPEYA